jgi:hypothetical protein
LVVHVGFNGMPRMPRTPPTPPSAVFDWTEKSSRPKTELQAALATTATSETIPLNTGDRLINKRPMLSSL